MRILILESMSGGIHPEIDDRLLPEGFAMLRTMVNEFSEAGFDVITILTKRLEGLADWLDADVHMNRDGLSEALRCRPDAALVIAPEKGGELEQITAKLRRGGITILGPNGEIIQTCADKWLTHRALRGTVPQPKTWRTPRDTEQPILIKPADGVGCEGIKFAAGPYNAGKVIFQEFVEGEHASCCLLMKEGKGVVLSVNKQEIVIKRGQFEYAGSAIPFEHPLEKECAGIALRAAEGLGLHGYCGVDLVVGEASYFIELNPRVTTSFVALAQVLQANLGKVAVDVLVDGASMPKLQLTGCSLVRIPKIRDIIRVNTEKLDMLREISGVVAPPFAPDGNPQRGSPFAVAESGSTPKSVKRKLNITLNEVTALLEVDRDAITWP
ncbi:MAG: hypothetical protein CEE41_00855 [Hadesarchaea archaeon B3_Hades]|nr:MAG: hypothetical protein CEE41_00855 [Hadesarchaea archaeon B3_Hades]